MGLWDLFKKKKASVYDEPRIVTPIPAQKKEPDASPAQDNKQNLFQNAKSKEDVMKILFQQMAQKAPSEHFASGAVFDIMRGQRDTFEEILRSRDAIALYKWFVTAYALFYTNPGVVGLSPSVMNMNNDDVNLKMWNADIFTLPSGEAVAQCFMSINDDAYEARIVGIIPGKSEDGYYYCMLKKDPAAMSEVKRNRGLFGTTTVGEVTGRGFELMESFLNCITADFTSLL